ncbi:hypothetical protein Clacol_006183 [Clathrus columnatus]|uniref:Solute carrier family 35 member F6 n=1 Tax=Clathrus columnatus TaxID=1419009 RepID=A0AAV5AGB9_9AGAM|nr:hypothetical protein Clacol_006183 [Clathrus columnatus]
MVVTGATNSLFTKKSDPVSPHSTKRLGTTANGVHLPLDDETEDVHHSLSNKKLIPLTGRRVILLWIPAFCDLTGTTHLPDDTWLFGTFRWYTVGYLSKKKTMALPFSLLGVGIIKQFFSSDLNSGHSIWAALITVMLGVSIVGLSGSMITESHQVPSLSGEEQGLNLTNIGEGLVAASKVLIRALKREEGEDIPQVTSAIVGVFFIVFAQLFTATQFVVEEKLLSKYNVDPLVAVGYEGFFGTISILLLIPILSFTPLRNLSSYFNLREGWNQIISTPSVLWTSIAIAISISLFNGFGLSVTRHLSATARSVIDSCRTLLIWIVSVFIGWEFLVFPTSLLQLCGFGMLVYGTFLFNNLISPPSFLAPSEQLLPNVTIDAPTGPTSAQLEEAREEAEGERRALLSGE